MELRLLLMVSLGMVFKTVPLGTKVGSAVLHSKADAGALTRLRANARKPPPKRDPLERCLRAHRILLDPPPPHPPCRRASRRGPDLFLLSRLGRCVGRSARV